jgi:hypothetical protein
MSHDVSKNNFDLIRLLAAAQVAVKHRATHRVISASSLPVVPQPLYKGASQPGSQ